MNGCTANGSKLYWERDGDSLVDDDVDVGVLLSEDEVICVRERLLELQAEGSVTVMSLALEVLHL